LDNITALERFRGSIPHAHYHWVGFCDTKGHEEGWNNNRIGGTCIMVVDFG